MSISSISANVHQFSSSHERLVSVAKSAAVGGVLGAAIGAGLSFTALPFIGALTAPIAAAVGGAAGIVVGSIVGLLRGRGPLHGAHAGVSTLIQAAPPAPVGAGSGTALPPALPSR